MRFIFLTLGYHPDLVGGAYRYVAEAAERLAARGHEIEVLCPNPQDRLPSVETRAGVRLHRFPNASGFFINNWRRENAAAKTRLRSLLSACGQKALLVLCHAFLAPCWAAHHGRSVFLFTGPWAEEYGLAQRAGPRSLFQRGLDALVRIGMRAEERRALRRVDRVLTISRYYQDQLPRWHGRGLAPVTMISAGVNLDWFRPAADREAVRAELGLSQGEFLFLTLRRLDPRMGLLVLLDGFVQVYQEYPQARLWLAGRGPQEAALRSRIQAAGLADRVRLLGLAPEPELPRLLSATDCLVMPSLDLEGFGLATVESLACGTPVLGSRAGANPELLGPLSEGLLFEAGSSAAVANSMRAVLAQPDRLPSRSRCRQYAMQFSWDRPVSAFEQCYGELVAGGSPR